MTILVIVGFRNRGGQREDVYVWGDKIMKMWLLTATRQKDGESEEIMKYIIHTEKEALDKEGAAMKISQLDCSTEQRRELYTNLFPLWSGEFDGTETWRLTSFNL
jgi:hypothetical protein